MLIKVHRKSNILISNKGPDKGPLYLDMIGIDITRISRFRSMNNLDRFLTKFNVDGTTPIAAAKTWACFEALIKARGTTFKFSRMRIKFPLNSAPKIVDPENVLEGEYHLTLTHEDDLVVAVALRLHPKYTKI